MVFVEEDVLTVKLVLMANANSPVKKVSQTAKVFALISKSIDKTVVSVVFPVLLVRFARLVNANFPVNKVLLNAVISA